MYTSQFHVEEGLKYQKQAFKPLTKINMNIALILKIGSDFLKPQKN